MKVSGQRQRVLDALAGKPIEVLRLPVSQMRRPPFRRPGKTRIRLPGVRVDAGRRAVSAAGLRRGDSSPAPSFPSTRPSHASHASTLALGRSSTTSQNRNCREVGRGPRVPRSTAAVGRRVAGRGANRPRSTFPQTECGGPHNRDAPATTRVRIRCPKTTGAAFPAGVRKPTLATRWEPYSS